MGREGHCPQGEQEKGRSTMGCGPDVTYSKGIGGGTNNREAHRHGDN